MADPVPVSDPAESAAPVASSTRQTAHPKPGLPSVPSSSSVRSGRTQLQVVETAPSRELASDPRRPSDSGPDPLAALALQQRTPTSLVRRRRPGRRSDRTIATSVDGRYDQLALCDWSYEQPLDVVADPGEDEVDRLLKELFPRTNGGVQNHFYSDPNMPPVRQMPQLHPEAEAVLDILDGADLPARVASALQERRAKREEEAQENARLEAEEARKAEAEEARKSAQARRMQRADDMVRAAAEADRMRIAEEEAKRAEERRLAYEAAREADRIAKADAGRVEERRLVLETHPPLAAGSRGRRKGRPRRVEEQAGGANVSATVGQVPSFKTWAAPVVVPAQGPEVRPPASDVAATAADPASRFGDGGPRKRVDNVVQFPGSKRLISAPGTLQPDIGAAQPKRRGRPPGSKNKIRRPPSDSATVPAGVGQSTTPVLRTTDSVSPAPALRPLRRLSSSAYPLLTAAFPLPSWRAVNALRDGWARSLPYDTDVLQQARSAIPPDCVRWRVRNGDVSFSEVVASVMTAGGQGARLLLFHDVHLGVAAIDVRCPRPQLVERWSRCIAAAKAGLPAGCELPHPDVLDQVERLRVGLTVSTLVECLWMVGLGMAVGSVQA
jgi:hypothetical protein